MPFDVQYANSLGLLRNQHAKRPNQISKGDSRWIAGVKLNLIDCWNNLAGRVAEKLLQVSDLKVGHANVLDFACVK